MNSGLRWYLTSSALFLVPGGIQIVLFPFLVAVVLAESPSRVGMAQMASQLPMLLLILWGGVVGDRLDQRKLLVGLQLGMVVPPLIIALLAAQDALSYTILVCWALVGGTFAAFAQPARDALLNRIAGAEIQRVVILSLGVQYGVQIFGFAVGSTAADLGVVPILICQAMVFALAAWTTRLIQLAPSPPRQATGTTALAEIREGIQLAWHSRTIRPAIFQAFAVGIFFAGTYVVVLPLMVRDVYNGDSGGIAMAFTANMLGMCTTIAWLMWRGGVARPGRALLLGSSVSLSVLSVLSQPLPEWMFYGVIYCWGMCGGISMTMSRGIVQEAAPEQARARLLSVYSLGFMGGMPIGSALLGWCVEWLGPHDAIWVPVVGMLTITLALGLLTDLWSVERAPPALPEHLEAG